MLYHLRGQVIRADDESGVPGLRIDVIDSDHQFDDYLGTVRTDHTGRFSVTYSEADYALQEAFEREPEVYVRVHDRTGRILHTDDRARPFPPEANQPIEIVLEGSVLAEHEADAMLWESPQASLFPEDRVEVIERAIGAGLAEPGTERYAKFRAAALCPAPDFLDVEDIVGRAFGALRGLPDESRRFREVLDDLVDSQRTTATDADFFEPTWFERLRSRTAAKALAYHALGPDRPPRASIREDVRYLSKDIELTSREPRLHALDSVTLDVNRLQRDPDVEAVLSEVRDRVESELRDGRSIVDPDGATIVFGAALAIADDIEQRREYAAVVLDQFRRFRLLTDTFEASAAMLAGDGQPEQLRTAIRRGAIECGPDDGPLPFPIPDRGPEGFEDLVAEDLWWLDCLLDVERSMRTRRRTSRYTVAEISPTEACAGDTITLTGTGFGDDPGIVIFTGDDGPVRVSPDAWSGTEIVVTLPSEARAGPLSLEIDDGTAEICGKFIVVRRRPSADSIDLFSGGRPSISLVVDSGPCVAPGETVRATWAVRPASTADVSLEIDRIGTFDVEPDGSREFTVPASITTPDVIEVSIDATTTCGQTTTVEAIVVDVVPELEVAGIEVTQGVQRFAIDGANNNSLDTIAEKDTIVRVYVSVDRNGFSGDAVEGVTGTLRVDGTTLSPQNGSIPTSRTARTSPTPTITAVANPDPEETDHSLNFLVPAALSSGTKTLRATVRSPTVCGSIPVATETRSWTWTENRALPVRFIRVRDDGPNGTSDRPTRAEARFTIQRAFDLLPSPPTDIAPAWDDTLETTEDISTTAGLGDLLDEVRAHRFSSIVAEWVDPSNTPLDLPHLLELMEQHHAALTAPFCRGIGGTRACVSCIYDPTHGDGVADDDPTTSLGNAVFRRVKTAHELGHTLDYDHVQVNCPGATAVACPSSGCYLHPNGGSLPADVSAFDPFWNAVLLDRADPPGQVTDFMGYGCARWSSPDSWDRLQGDI